MAERRAEARWLCADLLEIHWIDKSGASRQAIANLEDISRSGACLQMDQPLRLGTAVRICLPNDELFGRVKHCAYRDIGYYVGISFVGRRWSKSHYSPQHLLNPRSLVIRRLN